MMAGFEPWFAGTENKPLNFAINSYCLQLDSQQTNDSSQGNYL